MPAQLAGGPVADPIRAPFYHDGMRELQDRFDGRASPTVLRSIVSTSNSGSRTASPLEETRFFFVATSYQDNVDCFDAVRRSGFVKITGPARSECPGDGNNMYRTLGNIPATRMSGCCSSALTAGVRTRIRGKATIDDSATRLPGYHGAKVVVLVQCEISQLPALYSGPDGRFS